MVRLGVPVGHVVAVAEQVIRSQRATAEAFVKLFDASVAGARRPRGTSARPSTGRPGARRSSASAPVLASRGGAHRLPADHDARRGARVRAVPRKLEAARGRRAARRAGPRHPDTLPARSAFRPSSKPPDSGGGGAACRTPPPEGAGPSCSIRTAPYLEALEYFDRAGLRLLDVNVSSVPAEGPDRRAGLRGPLPSAGGCPHSSRRSPTSSARWVRSASPRGGAPSPAARAPRPPVADTHRTMLRTAVLRALPLTARVSRRARRAIAAGGVAFLAAVRALPRLHRFGLVEARRPSAWSGTGCSTRCCSSPPRCAWSGPAVALGRGPWIALGIGIGLLGHGMLYWTLLLRDLEAPPSPHWPTRSTSRSTRRSTSPSGCSPATASSASDAACGSTASSAALARSAWAPRSAAADHRHDQRRARPPWRSTSPIRWATCCCSPSSSALYALSGLGPGSRPGRCSASGSRSSRSRTPSTCNRWRATPSARARSSTPCGPPGSCSSPSPRGSRSHARAAGRLGTWGMVLFPFAFTLTSLGVLLYGVLPAGERGRAWSHPAVALLGRGPHGTDRWSRSGACSSARPRPAPTSSPAWPTAATSTSAPRRSWPIPGRGPPAALLLADLDGFKDLNDTLGHHAGTCC